MAFVGLKVDDGTKALWVEAADGENMSLSAWLKAAAADRLKGDQPVVLQVPIEEIAKVVETMTPGQSLSDAVDTSAPTNKHVEPAIETETEDKIKEARALLQGKRSYGTDFKPAKKEKRTR